MNVTYLKYALEIAKTGSISKAAENLFMGQPNLSRAIKELEESLDITLFKRTSKGIETTPVGEEFLMYAKKIIRELNSLESMYCEGKLNKQLFSITVPRASYIADAFVEFTKTLDNSKGSEIFYKESNSSRAISNILGADYKLGIIRFQNVFDQYFRQMLQEKNLDYRLITSFTPLVLMSKNHPLAEQEYINSDDLSPFIEVVHGDPYVPSLSSNATKKIEYVDTVDRRIFVYERGSQLSLLEGNSNTFMFVSPVPKHLLEKYNLVLIKYNEPDKVYKDVLIFKHGHRFTKLEDEFLLKLCESKRKYHMN